jgi:hypothetical protein
MCQTSADAVGANQLLADGLLCTGFRPDIRSLSLIVGYRIRTMGSSRNNRPTTMCQTSADAVGANQLLADGLYVSLVSLARVPGAPASVGMGGRRWAAMGRRRAEVGSHGQTAAGNGGVAATIALGGDAALL